MADMILRAAAIAAFDDERVDRYYGDVSPESVIKVIESIPVVDAAPVVHGRWKGYNVPHWTKRYKDNGDPEYKYHAEYVCSICRRKTIIKENYCPNCGAKMDKEG